MVANDHVFGLMVDSLFYTSCCLNLNFIESLKIQGKQCIKRRFVLSVGFGPALCDRRFEILEFLIIFGI